MGPSDIAAARSTAPLKRLKNALSCLPHACLVFMPTALQRRSDCHKVTKVTVACCKSCLSSLRHACLVTTVSSRRLCATPGSRERMRLQTRKRRRPLDFARNRHTLIGCRTKKLDRLHEGHEGY